jgi:uncharacterized membrane protein YccC
MSMNSTAAGRNPASIGSAFRAALPAVLYGLRLSASVILALFVAYELELQNAFWAGTSAAIVCQPSLGASLRKGWFRAVGTMIGAVAIVVLTALFPQSRFGMLASLTLWCGLCGFMATVLRDFAGYAAALSGYTAAIVFADALSAPNDTFTLAVDRGTEICIGIVCAGLVLTLTDFGDARRRLGRAFADAIATVTSGLAATLSPDPDFTAIRDERRALVARVVVLHTSIDEAIGESSELRSRRRTLQAGAEGLFSAIASWRGVANRLERATDEGLREAVRGFLGVLRGAAGSPDDGVRRLLRTSASDMDTRFLVDNLARSLLSLRHAVEALGLIEGTRSRIRRPPRGRFLVPDVLPAIVNGLRVAIALAAVELIWIETAWPSGPTMVIFTAVGVILFSPRDAQAYPLVLGFAIGTTLAAGLAAIVNFAVLPTLDGFLALSLVLAAALTPLGAISTGTFWQAGFIGMAMNFVPLLAPSNQPVYDPEAFLNSALGIVAGTIAAAASIRLMPPLSPAYRTRRLLALTLRDMRRLAAGRRRLDRRAWTNLVSQRLGALPPEAAPEQHAQLITTLSIGDAAIYLRRPHRLAERASLERALDALALGEVATSRSWFRRFAVAEAGRPEGTHPTVMRCRVAAALIIDALDQHAAFFAAPAGGRGLPSLAARRVADAVH